MNVTTATSLCSETEKLLLLLFLSLYLCYNHEVQSFVKFGLFGNQKPLTNSLALVAHLYTPTNLYTHTHSHTDTLVHPYMHIYTLMHTDTFAGFIVGYYGYLIFLPVFIQFFS